MRQDRVLRAAQTPIMSLPITRSLGREPEAEHLWARALRRYHCEASMSPDQVWWIQALPSATLESPRGDLTLTAPISS